MADDVASAEPAATIRLRERMEATLLSFTREEHTRALAVALFVLGPALMLLYRPFSQLEVGDSALYDYIGQSILRGQVPYRDVVDIKTPGSMYLTAFVMAVGKLVGVRDIIAVRLFQSLLVGVFCVVVFYVARAYSRSSLAALIAAVFPLMSHNFAEWMVIGTQPKLSMILFGMLCLFFISKDKPFWSGALSMLSFLCWQPGLMFFGVAMLMFSRYLTRWRDGQALKVLIGASIPLVIVLGYFQSRGALDDLWAWTIEYSYTVFRPEAQRAPLRALLHLWNVTVRIFGVQIVLVLMAIIAFLIAIFERVRARLRRKIDSNRLGDALLILPIVYLAFCVIDMQAGPDLIPFYPFIGIFAGILIVRVGKRVDKRADARAGWSLWLPTATLTLMLMMALGQASLYRTYPGFTLGDQDNNFKVLSELLDPGDKIYVQGPVEVLVVLGRPNMNPYLLLNKGVDSFAAARRKTDFSTIVTEMEAERPKLVALSRLQNVRSRELLQGWVDEHYEQLDSFKYTSVYVRKAP